MTAQLDGIFHGDAREEYGVDYTRLLGRKIAKKDFNVSFKDHDALVKQLIEEVKAGLADAVARIPS